VVERLLWKQKVCIAGVGVWGKHVGKLDVVFDEYGVVESCSGDAVPLDDGITPVASIQVTMCTCATTRTTRHAGLLLFRSLESIPRRR
jgi:hypothetical protein